MKNKTTSKYSIETLLPLVVKRNDRNCICSANLPLCEHDLYWAYQLGIEEAWKDKNAYASAVVKERNIEAYEVIEDLCNQFGYQDHDKKVKKYDYYSGGLSALEGAFTWLIINGYATGDHLTVKLKDKK